MKNKLFNRTKQFALLFKSGKYNIVIRAISKRLFSINKSYGLKRDLNAYFEAPKAKIDIIIREFQIEDEVYFKEDTANFGLINENIKHCYVAVNNDGIPCFKQWLIESSYNSKISDFFGDLFPVLNKGEALLEGGFTLASYRGLKIMPAAISLILEKGKEMNIRYAITFVGVHNIASIRGCYQSGLSLYIMRIEYWFLFLKITKFKKLNSKYSQDFLNIVA